MQNITEITARPCFGRSFSLSITTFLLSVLSFIISGEIEANTALCIVIGALLLIANIVLSVYSIGKFNSKVSVHLEGLHQKQFSKAIRITFNDIALSILKNELKKHCIYD